MIFCQHKLSNIQKFLKNVLSVDCTLPSFIVVFITYICFLHLNEICGRKEKNKYFCSVYHLDLCQIHFYPFLFSSFSFFSKHVFIGQRLFLDLCFLIYKMGMIVVFISMPLLLLLLLSCFSRVRLCNPIDGSPPGFSIPGILQARILGWVAISFSKKVVQGPTIPRNINKIMSM